MLRNPSSKISLSMNEVDQLQHRLRLKKAANSFHPITLGHASHGNLPILRKGAQRSRDDCLVLGDPARHTMQSVAVEAVLDSDEDSGATNPDTGLTARIVQVAEVSPVITEVSSYNPPAALVEFQNPPPNRRSCHMTQPVTDHTETRIASNSTFETNYLEELCGSNTIDRPDQAVPQGRYLAGGSNPCTSVGSTIPATALLDPNAATFVPRVRFGSSIRRASSRRPTNDPDHYFEQERLDLRSTSLRNPPPRGHLGNFSRPLPRLRGRPRYSRPSSRSSSRTSNAGSQPPIGHATLLATDSLSMVHDRYPVFPSLGPGAENATRSHQRLASPPQNVPFQRRPDARHLHGSNFPRLRQRPSTNLPQEVDLLSPVRSRTSSSSVSVPNLVPHPQRPTLHSRRSSLNWSKTQVQPLSNPRSPESPNIGSTSSHLDHYQGSATSNERSRQSSPLDDLAAELHSWSTRLSARTPPLSSRLPSPAHSEMRLLSGGLFYPPHEDEREATGHDPGLWSGLWSEDVRTSLQVPSRSRASTGVSRRDQIEAMVQMRITEAGQNLPLASPPNRSSFTSSSSITDTQFSTSSPPRVVVQESGWPSTALGTPYSTRPIASTRATPRVKVYDDTQPANTQPHTSADLSRRRSLANHLQSVPASYDQQDQNRTPYSSNSDLRATAAPPTVDRRRASMLTSNDQENELDSITTGMLIEREAWARRRTNGGEDMTLETTPPREGRFERYMDS